MRDDGQIVKQFDYAPFGKVLNTADVNRTKFIGKEKDKESNYADHGVRKYDDEIGRFTSIDPLWEKYYSLTPYQYAGNNPVSFLDFDGMDIKQREAALEYAKSYLNSGSTYEFGAKGSPGKPVDCSGFIDKSVQAGGEEPLVGRSEGTGIQQIEKLTEEIKDNKQVEEGNIVTFRYGGDGYTFHGGIVSKVYKDGEGNPVSFDYMHSSSSNKGPGVNNKTFDDKKVHGFYKWDKIPEKVELISPSLPVIQKSIDPRIK